MTEGHANGVCKTPGDGLELRTALARLTVDSVPTLTTRENSEIRKVKTADLPALEHVFAEGLYFTLTDVVLLPCIYQYLVRALELMIYVSVLSLTNPCGKEPCLCYSSESWPKFDPLVHIKSFFHFSIITFIISYKQNADYCAKA